MEEYEDHVIKDRDGVKIAIIRSQLLSLMFRRY